MKKIRTIQDVKKVPETEFIDMIVYGEGICPFCGGKLRSEIVGFGRDKCRQYYSCTCEVAQAAEAHNERLKELEHEALLRRREEEEKRLEEKANAIRVTTPVKFSAAEIFAVITGLVFPGLWFKQVLEKAEEAAYYRRRPFFIAKNAKAELLAYAEENGFGDALEKASAVMAEYVKQPEIVWETDISDKIKDVCANYGVPEEISI